MNVPLYCHVFNRSLPCKWTPASYIYSCTSGIVGEGRFDSRRIFINCAHSLFFRKISKLGFHGPGERKFSYESKSVKILKFRCDLIPENGFLKTFPEGKFLVQFIPDSFLARKLFFDLKFMTAWNSCCEGILLWKEICSLPQRKETLHALAKFSPFPRILSWRKEFPRQTTKFSPFPRILLWRNFHHFVSFFTFLEFLLLGRNSSLRKEFLCSLNSSCLQGAFRPIFTCPIF